MHKTKALRQESYYHGCFVKTNTRPNISLPVHINIWSKALLFFEPRLLTICLIAMYCNGDILRNQSKFQFSSNKIPLCLITSIYN